MTAAFLAQMELILRLYLLPYNPLRPVVCYDERPCFLIGNTVQGIEMEAEKPAKEHYAYSKHGSCCILAAIEPKSGKRLVHVRKKRGYREFSIFMKHLAATYPDAEKLSWSWTTSIPITLEIFMKPSTLNRPQTWQTALSLFTPLKALRGST